MSEENNPIAVIRKGTPEEMVEKMKTAISDELGEEVIELTNISFNDEWGIGETIEIVTEDDNSVYRYNIVPTWEY
jgi:hypothetical protein